VRDPRLFAAKGRLPLCEETPNRGTQPDPDSGY
jgi:hypothetical protein